MTEELAQVIEMYLARESEEKSAQVGFKRLSEDATIPTKAHATDSGFDLVASADVIVQPGDTVVVPTGIAVSLPDGFEASVRPRSGITSRTKIRVQYGTVDNSYNGEVGVIVDNISVKDGRKSHLWMLLGGTRKFKPSKIDLNTYLIRKGDKLAQLVITRLPDVEAIEVFDVEDSARGANGFGSSGVTAE